MPYRIVLEPDAKKRFVGPVPVAPLSSATISGMVPLHVIVTCAVALSVEVSSDALPKFMFVADTLHWFDTAADTENVPLTIVVPPVLTSAGHVDCEAVFQ